MIIIRPKGGLGNQLFQFAIGWALARDRNEDPWFDLSHYQPGGPRNFELGRLGLPVRTIGAYSRLVRRCFNPETAWGSRFLRYQDRLLPTTWHPHRTDSCPLAALLIDRRRHLFLDGYWQDYHFFDAHADSLRELLITNLARLASQAAIATALAGCDAAIHVRRGDYRTNPMVATGFGCLDEAYYHRALGLLASMRPLRRIALFSDEPDWVMANWRLPVELVRPVLSGGIEGDPLIDLLLMSQAPALVIANSTLSWWGAWIGDKADRPVVAPARWTLGSAEHIVPRLPGHWHPL